MKKIDHPVLFVLDFLLGLLIIGLGVWSSYLLIYDWQDQSVSNWIRPIILIALVFVLGISQVVVALRRRHSSEKSA